MTGDNVTNDFLDNLGANQYLKMHNKERPNMTKFLMFTKESCGPCGLVKRYIGALEDSRESVIQEIYLEDVSDVPIPEENLSLAKKYGVTATPVLVIADADGELLETYIGGLPITQNIRKLWEKYDV
jgi:thioredoxin-related protein